MQVLPTVVNVGAIALYHQWTEYNLPIAINDLNCTGSEERITACPQNALDSAACNHYQDASVVCQPLEGETYQCNTRLII